MNKAEEINVELEGRKDSYARLSEYAKRMEHIQDRKEEKETEGVQG